MKILEKDADRQREILRKRVEVQQRDFKKKLNRDLVTVEFVKYSYVKMGTKQGGGAQCTINKITVQNVKYYLNRPGMTFTLTKSIPECFSSLFSMYSLYYKAISFPWFFITNYSKIVM